MIESKGLWDFKSENHNTEEVLKLFFKYTDVDYKKYHLYTILHKTVNSSLLISFLLFRTMVGKKHNFSCSFPFHHTSDQHRPIPFNRFLQPWS